MSVTYSFRYDLQRPLPNGGREIVANCTAEFIRDELYRGRLSGEELVRVVGKQPWCEIAARDEFDNDIPQIGRRKTLAAATESDEMDMTPMIDVTFLLLIFFMVTASFHLQKGLDFPASQKTPEPSAHRQQAPGLPAFDDRIVLQISGADEFSFKNAKTGEDGGKISPSELSRHIKEMSASSKKNKLLIIAHESSSHEATVAVIDAAARAGVIDVALADVLSEATSVPHSNRILRNP